MNLIDFFLIINCLFFIDSYVGCLRIKAASAEPKRKRRGLQDDIALFGALDRKGCPIN